VHDGAQFWQRGVIVLAESGGRIARADFFTEPVGTPQEASGA
jgi:hypothetical protein